MLYLGELFIEASQGTMKGGSAVADSSCSATQRQAVLNYAYQLQLLLTAEFCVVATL